VKELVREMTVKAGQKCTAIRRAIVPRTQLDALCTAVRARLSKVTVGDPALEAVRMGALASRSQQRDVAERVAQLAAGNELVFGERDGFAPLGEGVSEGSFCAPTLLLCRDPLSSERVHDTEAFGPVSTLLPYDDFDEALALAARGRGSLVATVVTHDRATAAEAVASLAPLHGRIHILDRESAAGSTAQTRRPRARRRWRGTRRPARGEALPAARRGAGLADDADGRHRRVRARCSPCRT
jgi:oxepin-CoA hydrolase / 3-oxo-5,6-dehydrosuberyl-CoA semialdehyde dehydrogenase